MTDPKPVDFQQCVTYNLEVMCPHKDCMADITDEQPDKPFERGDSIQCPYCQRFFELGEEL